MDEYPVQQHSFYFFQESRGENQYGMSGTHFSFSSNMNLLSIYKNHSVSLEKYLILSSLLLLFLL